jgi:hypothetical protein
MPINLPNLDDRTFSDLMEEALARIPAHAPEWTNHNPSDPGITILELFAFLTEMLIYRLNRVTEENKLAFLKLLNEPKWKYNKTKTLDQNIQVTVLSLREEQRAVTVKDFERLALAADSNVRRAYCLPRRNLESGLPDAAGNEQAGHVSVVIVPSAPFQAGDKLISAVKNYLQPRCLITTRLHVAGPRYLKIGVNISLKINPDSLEQNVLGDALEALNDFFHPLTGGTQGTGWPLGRNVYVSDIYALLDKLPGVDYVEKVLKNNKPLEELAPKDKSRRILAENRSQLVGVRLDPDELVDFQVKESDIQIDRDKNIRNRIQD